MFDVTINRSIYTREFVRKYKKIDIILAEIFGLFGLLSFFFCIYRGYNEYSFEQIIRKDLGLPYDKKRNLLKSYKFYIRKYLYQWF